MLNNPRTSISGIAVLVVVAAYVVYGFITGHPLDMGTALTAIGGAAIGTGLIGSKDGTL